MKKIKYILTLMIAGITLQLFGQSGKQDTTFILRESADRVSHSIFIDKNKDSKFYDDINDFRFGQFDKQSYDNSLEYFKDNQIRLTKKSIPEVPNRWITLKQYKGKYYVYHPCDFLYHYKISINDTTFIDWTGEGPVANKILEAKKIDHQKFEIKLTGIYNNNRHLVIHMIDKLKGIAVFEETLNGTDKEYYLMITAETIKSVPLIVNYCPTQKESELHFENPNYIELIKLK